jgi:hypothetical protein
MIIAIITLLVVTGMVQAVRVTSITLELPVIVPAPTHVCVSDTRKKASRPGPLVSVTRTPKIIPNI